MTNQQASEKHTTSYPVGDRRGTIGEHPYLEWTTTSTNERCTVALVGELDLASCNQLETGLCESLQAAETIVFDVGALTFVDSSGLHLFLRWQQNAQAWGGKLLLINAPAHLCRLVNVAGLTEWFDHVTVS